MTENGAAGTICVTTTLHAKPGEEAKLIEVLRSLAQQCRGEPGCLLFEPVRSRHEPGRFLLVERYRDEQGLTDHANSDHMRAALSGLMECVRRPPELVVYEEIAGA